MAPRRCARRTPARRGAQGQLLEMSLSQRPHRPGIGASAPAAYRPSRRHDTDMKKKTASKSRAGALSATGVRKTPAVPDRVPAPWAARLRKLRSEHERFLSRRNPVDPGWDNGVFERFRNPALTYRHAPIEWRF